MSQNTREEVLAKWRERYARYACAGKEHKAKIIAEAAALFGYHPKAAIRALRREPKAVAPDVRGVAQGVRSGYHAAAAQGHLRPGFLRIQTRANYGNTYFELPACRLTVPRVTPIFEFRRPSALSE